jgi:hypothetical protein
MNNHTKMIHMANIRFDRIAFLLFILFIYLLLLLFDFVGLMTSKG